VHVTKHSPWSNKRQHNSATLICIQQQQLVYQAGLQ